MSVAKSKPRRGVSKKQPPGLTPQQISALLHRMCALDTTVEAAFAMLNLLSEKSREFFNDGMGVFGETYHGGLVHLACDSADKLKAEFDALYQEIHPLLEPKNAGGAK
mgnify:CR=1 FL=1